MRRPVRVSARGVLVDESRVLLTHLRHEQIGDFYEVPGGGVRWGETLRQTASREVHEETGHSVTVHELLWVRDHIADVDEPAYVHPPGFHGLDLLFRCSLAGPALAGAHEADEYQVGVEWVDADQLPGLQLVPAALVPLLQAFLVDRTVLLPRYLGVI